MEAKSVKGRSVTLSTSAIEKKATRLALIYLLISVLCALFGCIYEHFSHGVYSYHMIYAFAYPLVGGTLPALWAVVFGCKRPPAALPRLLYHCGIATFTVGSIITAVLEIYGTSSPLTTCYWAVAMLLTLSSVVLHLSPRRRS